MSDTGKRPPSLGRGLSALLGEEGQDYAQLDRVRATKTVPIEFLHPSKFQPRHNFDAEEIRGLADSIRKNGILQPILVRRDPASPNNYEIVAGERRWRAAQEAQLHEVPVIVRELSDRDMLEVALVENLQRKDLSPIEEAAGYQRLLDEFGYTQEELAQALGKSRSHLANTLRLLALPEGVKRLVDTGQVSAGHARALLVAKDPMALAQRIVKSGLSVRQTERIVQREKHGERQGRVAARAERAKDADTLALERDLSNLLGLKVSITFDGEGGTLTIHYNTLEQLDDVLKRLHERPKAPE